MKKVLKTHIKEYTQADGKKFYTVHALIFEWFGFIPLILYKSIFYPPDYVFKCQFEIGRRFQEEHKFYTYEDAVKAKSYAIEEIVLGNRRVKNEKIVKTRKISDNEH